MKTLNKKELTEVNGGLIPLAPLVPIAAVVAAAIVVKEQLDNKEDSSVDGND